MKQICKQTLEWIVSTKPRKSLGKSLLIGTTALFVAAPVASQNADNWPERTVRIIIPYTPGGAIDTMTRLIAPRLEKELGQPFVVENRPGAGGVVGTEASARMNDGHTLLGTAMGHVIAPHLHSKLNYDPLADFDGVATMAVVPNVLVVPASSPYQSVEDLLADARANPGKVTYGSAGTGTSLHMAAAMFAAMADLDLTHVPYRGSAPAIMDLVAGRIDLMFDSSTSAAPFVADGRLRALAVATSEKTDAFPDLPTIGDSAVPGYEVDWWYGILAPKGMSDAAIQRLSAAIATQINDPDVQESFRKIKIEPLVMTPSELQSTMQSDASRWGDLVKQLGIEPN
ncbi:Bug family tripartite tricarboxylate transporter substrate binding protein [Orrella marina]|nr:tripartite tricarboxylate transporter substrate binding protein [Orrella marina]